MSFPKKRKMQPLDGPPARRLLGGAPCMPGAGFCGLVCGAFVAFGVLGVFGCAAPGPAAPAADSRDSTDAAGAPDAPVGDGPADLTPPDAARLADAPDAVAPPSPWRIEPLGPTGDLNAAGCGPDGQFWAVGSGGTILRGFGAGWAPSASGSEVELYGVAGLAGGRAVAVGAAGTLLAFDGAQWQARPTPTDATLYGVWGLAGDAIVAVGQGGTVLRGSVAGPLSVESALTSGDLRVVWGNETGDLYAAGDGGLVFAWRGGAWVAEQVLGPATTVRGLWGTADGSLVVAVGTNGELARRTANGWRADTTNDPLARDLHAVWGRHAGAVFAVGAAGVLVAYDGARWSLVDLAGPTTRQATLLGLAGCETSAGADIRAVGSAGTGVALDATGQFSDQATAPRATLRALWGAPGGELFAVGDAGLALQRGPSGWQLQPTPTTASLYALFGRTANDVFAVGAAGLVLHFDGTRWSQLPPPTDAALRAVTGGPGGLLFVAGDHGTVFRLQGSEWVAEECPTAARLTALGAVGDTLWAVGARGTVLRRDPDAGWQAEAVPTLVDLHALLLDGPELWVAGDHGALLQRAPSGTWQIVRESPGDYLYGLGGGSALLVAVGWGGLVWRGPAQGPFAREDAGTFAPLRAVSVAGPGAAVWAAGDAGTIVTRAP